MLGIALTFAKGIFAPLAALWRWLTDDWHRMAFAVLIALCAFLAFRLSSIDGDRDEWRDKAQDYEAASKAVAKASKAADRIGLEAVAKSKGETNARIERAKQAGAGSPDPLADTLRCLRSEADCGSGQTAR